MGTWGEGLYDNDGALDELGDLFDALPLHAGAVPMATTVGLATWLLAPVRSGNSAGSFPETLRCP
jgi:hypothetical protein